jgi:hypothetical protein
MPTNKSTITVITTTISILAILCVGTICYLSYLKIEVPKDLAMIATGVVGALTGMLVKTSPSSATGPTEFPPNGGAPAPVEIVNKEENPVPTKEKP